MIWYKIRIKQRYLWLQNSSSNEMWTPWIVCITYGSTILSVKSKWQKDSFSKPIHVFWNVIIYVTVHNISCHLLLSCTIEWYCSELRLLVKLLSNDYIQLKKITYIKNKNTFKSMAFGYKNYIFEIFSQNKIIFLPPPKKKKKKKLNNNNLESRIMFADVTQFIYESRTTLTVLTTCQENLISSSYSTAICRKTITAGRGSYPVKSVVLRKTLCFRWTWKRFTVYTAFGMVNLKVIYISKTRQNTSNRLSAVEGPLLDGRTRPKREPNCAGDSALNT